MPNDVSTKYRAFISYSHKDSTTAKRVHARLEQFMVDKDLVGQGTNMGPIPKTLRPIFLDRHDFDAGSDLAQQTIKALDSSAALIVIASIDAAKSRAVNEEIRLFKLRHPDRPIVPLIGERASGDIETDCFPPALRFELTSEGVVSRVPAHPLGADLRKTGDGLELALAKTIARLLGVVPDEIFRRAERQRRRRDNIRNGAIGILGLLVISVGAAAYNWYYEQRWRQVLLDAYVEQQRQINGIASLPEEAEKRLRSGEIFQECKPRCPEMVVIPPGQFAMGSLDTEKGHHSSEKPQHNVKIGYRFAVSRFTITAEQWEACVASKACSEAPNQRFGRGTQPAINMSWRDAQDYVVWLSKLTNRTYRLLTESEWEYAARAGSPNAYPWGSDIGVGNANCDGCGSIWDAKSTAPVGSFPPNGFGLYDMVGNVWQWCEDAWHEDYDEAPLDGSAWQTQDLAPDRVLRGGSWKSLPHEIRVAARNSFSGRQIQREFNLGFGIRVARTIIPPS